MFSSSFFGSSSGSSFGFSSSSSSGLSSFSSSQSGGTRPHDITSKQGLTNLYNSGVASVEHVSRPMGGVIGAMGVPHSGVVVTTDSGDRWLVHKGKGYGDSSKIFSHCFIC